MSDEHARSGDGIPRRQFLVRAGGGGLMLASGGLLAACGGVKESSSSSGDVIKVGYVSPRTGPAAAFGETDDYLLDRVREATKDGIESGGKTYKVEFILKDSQANPQRAAEVANGLITGDKVDLMLASSTPESVNPVSDACEAAGVPCISTVVPWQAWYLGRGAKPTDKKAFKYTYHFAFGVENFAEAYLSQWNLLPTNKKVGFLLPNDSDGNAIRAAMIPIIEKAGFTAVDPGPYEDGTNDYSAQIAKFKSAKVDIFNTFPLPPDFATFWKQAAQQGFKPKIAQVAKTGLFPSQVEALGDLGPGLATAAFWHPQFPYKSSLTGLGGKELADGYEKASGKQWTMILGSGFALFDAGVAALKAAPDPHDKTGLADTIGKLKVDTPLGTLDWTKGPNGNVNNGPIIGSQWVKASGGKFPLDLVITENAGDKNVPIQAKLQPFGS